MLNENKWQIQVVCSSDNIADLDRLVPLGKLAGQPAEPNPAFANDRDTDVYAHSFVEYSRMGIMKGIDPSAPVKLRIAIILLEITTIVLIAFFIIGCVGAENPAFSAPTPSVAKTNELIFLTPRATAAPFSGTATPFPQITQAPVQEQAFLPEKRLLSIEWPATIRVGDSDIIRLTLETDKRGQITPSAEVNGHQIIGQQVSIPDLYDLDNIIAEARLDMAGLQVSPDGAVRQTMLPGQTLVFYWSISPGQAGLYRGVLWVYLDLIPKNGGEMDQRALMAHRIDIQSTTVLGLPAATARWISAGGAVFSSILGFPFLEKLLEKLWRRFRPEK